MLGLDKDLLNTVGSFLKEGRTDDEYKGLSKHRSLYLIAKGDKTGYIDSVRFSPEEAKSLYSVYESADNKTQFDSMSMSQMKDTLVEMANREYNDRVAEEERSRISSLVDMITTIEQKEGRS